MPVFPKRRFQHGAVGADAATRASSFSGRGGLPLALLLPATPDAAVSSAYPAEDAARDRWILGPAASAKPARSATRLRRARRAGGLGGRRGGRRRHDLPDQPRVPVALPDVRPVEEHAGRRPCRGGAIAAQIRDGAGADFRRRGASSSTTPAASSIRGRSPPRTTPRSPRLVRPFERVIVEAHPALVGEACLRFRDLIAGRLEVAMGLETVHPDVLPRLNKRMTLEPFAEAAAFLREAGIALRVFVLAGLPFLGEEEGLEATRRSIAWAFDHGASSVSVDPDALGQRLAGRARGSRRVRGALALRARGCGRVRARARPRARLRGPLGPRAVPPLRSLLRRARGPARGDEPPPARPFRESPCPACGGPA